MDVETAIRARRSVRRFQQTPVPPAQLRTLADLARLYPSAGNVQPLRCAVVTAQPRRDKVFASLNWAMYLKDFEIRPDQRPTAYLVLLSTRPEARADAGAAAMAVMLAAQAMGLGSCCLQPARPAALREALSLGPELTPALVVALGYAAQENRAVPMAEDCRYWEDDAGNLRVPKLGLDKTLVLFD